ncbi:MAG TPA: hypothetical protein VGE05_03875 [Novosphingobium sp.]
MRMPVKRAFAAVAERVFPHLPMHRIADAVNGIQSPFSGASLAAERLPSPRFVATTGYEWKKPAIAAEPEMKLLRGVGRNGS